MKDKKRSFCCDEQASGFSVLTADELFFINGGVEEGENNNQNDNSQEYKLDVSLEGKVEFDESTGKPKGSASTKIGISVSGKKN